MTAGPIATHFVGINALMTSPQNVAFICRLTGSLVSLAYIFDMIFMDVCVTGTGGRPVDWSSN